MNITAKTARAAAAIAIFAAYLAGSVFAGDRDRMKNRHAHQQHHRYHSQQHYGRGYHHGYRQPDGHYYSSAGYHRWPRQYGSTYSEGVLRGVAAVINAQGAFNLNSAIAASFVEDARSKRIDNQVKRTEAYFAKRAINQAARTTESKEERAAKVRRIAEAAKPDRLGPTRFRPDLGLLNWPTMLRRPEFQQLRGSIDSLVATGPAAMIRHGSQIEAKAKMMREAMKPMVRSVSPHEYAAARQFLLSLRYESQLAIRTDGASLARHPMAVVQK